MGARREVDTLLHTSPSFTLSLLLVGGQNSATRGGERRPRGGGGGRGAGAAAATAAVAAADGLKNNPSWVFRF